MDSRITLINRTAEALQRAEAHLDSAHAAIEPKDAAAVRTGLDDLAAGRADDARRRGV